MTKQETQNQIKAWINDHMPYSPFKTAETGGAFHYEPYIDKIDIEALGNLISLLEQLDNIEGSNNDTARIIELLADKKSIAKFATFDFENYKMDVYNHLIDTESVGEPDEGGSFMQRAEAEANDEQQVVIANAESDFREFFELLEVKLED